jgi:tetratricopeptide (TPR) repeat protein
LKEELLQAVWHESFVEEGNLAQQISALRKALADCAGYIVTIPGRGYQFTASVTRQEIPIAAAAAAPAVAGSFVVQTVRARMHFVIDDEPKALPAPAFRRLWPGAAAIVVCLAGGGWLLWNHLHSASAGGYHAIVLADFDNRSGDDAFDFVLKNALEIDLEQSPMLNPLSLSQTRHTLQLMDRSPEERLTPAIAREVCERNDAQAVLGGSIVKFDSGYVVTLDAADCVSGKQLAKFEAEAANQTDTLRALNGIADRMRHKLGESLRSVEGFDVPIEQTTTSSFDALVAYSRATHQTPAAAIAFYQRALQLDPNFAMAWEGLGVSYGNLGNIPAASDAFAKAYNLHQPVSPREQFTITSRYYEIVQNDLDLAAKNYELWARSYPLDHWVWGTLCNTYTQMGRYPEAIAAGERGFAVDPNFDFNYVVLARAYKRAGLFDKAKAIGQQAIERHHDPWGVHSILFQIAVYERDGAAMARENAWDKGQPTETETLDNAAFAAATMGQLEQADRLFQQAQDASVGHHMEDVAVDINADKAEAERLLGQPDAARRHAEQVPTDLDEVSFEAALNAAYAGDTAYTRRVLDGLNKQALTATLIRKVRIPLLNAAIALEEHKPAEAVSIVQPAKVYELRDYYVDSLLGQAFLDLHQPDQAVAAYNEVLNHPGIDPVSPSYPLAHLGLARAYRQQRRFAESRAEYERLFALWNHGESSTTVLQAARSEYALLPH